MQFTCFVMILNKVCTNIPSLFSPHKHCTGTDADLEPDEVEEALLAYKNRQCSERPILAVEVKDGRHGATHVWSMEKFK